MTASPFDIELDDMTLARARRGDLAACEAIYRAYESPAYSVAFRICQSHVLSEEIMQEAFITAFRRIDQFRGDAPFWGWLRRVVVNHTISAVRRLPKNEVPELDDHQAEKAAVASRPGLALDLESALAGLAPEDRAVVWLYDVEGYTHREIAERFGKTESFSKTRLSRARARLRELLDAGADTAGGKTACASAATR